MSKSMAFAAALAAFLIVSVATRAAEPAAMFGMQLQKPLAIPQCPYQTDSGKAYYESPRAGACYELTCGAEPGEVDDASRVADKLPADGPVLIVWEVADKPAIVAGRGVVATLAGGKLQSVVFPTRGVRSQEAVYRALVTQFGTATSLQQLPSPASHELDSAASPMLAKWKLDRVDVLFYSAVRGPDEGVVSINAGGR